MKITANDAVNNHLWLSSGTVSKRIVDAFSLYTANLGHKTSYTQYPIYTQATRPEHPIESDGSIEEIGTPWPCTCSSSKEKKKI